MILDSTSAPCFKVSITILFCFHRDYSYRYGPPTRTDYRLIVENLSSRISWQVRIELERFGAIIIPSPVTQGPGHELHVWLRAGRTVIITLAWTVWAITFDLENITGSLQEDDLQLSISVNGHLIVSKKIKIIERYQWTMEWSIKQWRQKRKNWRF